MDEVCVSREMCVYIYSPDTFFPWLFLRELGRNSKVREQKEAFLFPTESLPKKPAEGEYAIQLH